MTVATIESSSRLQDIFALNVSACTVEVCLASVRPKEAIPDFKRVHLNQPTKETFREIVKPILLKGNKDAQSHNLKILEFDVSSKPDSHETKSNMLISLKSHMTRLQNRYSRWLCFTDWILSKTKLLSSKTCAFM